MLTAKLIAIASGADTDAEEGDSDARQQGKVVAHPRQPARLVISASPERIYDLVSDLPRMGEWSPECERVEWTGGTTVAAEGARFVGHNRGGPFG